MVGVVQRNCRLCEIEEVLMHMSFLEEAFVLRALPTWERGRVT